MIHELRKRKGLTQKQLAEKIGVARSSVAKWETGMTSSLTKCKVERGGSMNFMREKRILENKTLKDVAVLTYEGVNAITYTGGVIGIGSKGVYALADGYQIFVLDVDGGDYYTCNAATLINKDAATLVGTVYVVLNDNNEAEAIYFFTNEPSNTEITP